MRLTSRGARRRPGTIGGVAGTGPASQAATTSATTSDGGRAARPAVRVGRPRGQPGPTGGHRRTMRGVARSSPAVRADPRADQRPATRTRDCLDTALAVAASQPTRHRDALLDPSPTRGPTSRPTTGPSGPSGPPSPAAVRLEGVVKRYGDVVAVAGIDLDVRDGEFFSMLGPSGSGKTTTLRMIAGLRAADRAGGCSSTART